MIYYGKLDESYREKVAELGSNKEAKKKMVLEFAD